MQNIKVNILYINKNKDIDHIYKLISNYKDLQLEWLKRFPDLPWDWNRISSKSNLSLEWLLQFPDKPTQQELVNLTIWN